ncbi:MAG: hypothetical protein ABI851_03750 [Saprospiraceae bacterium]
MKNVLFLFVACLVFNSLQAQDPTTRKTTGPAATSAKAKPAPAMDKTSSTAAGTATTASSTPRKHVCTAACSADKHVLAHGEVGHVCGAACKADPKSAKAQPAGATKTMAPGK